MLVSTVEQALTELVEQHRVLYEGPTIEAKLRPLIRIGLHTNLTQGDVLHILRTSRSVFFDTHVEVVSGHHTATYLRFESIARFPELIRKVAGDMAGWIQQTFRNNPITGLVATSSAAEQLAEGIAAELRGTMRVNVALTSYSCETGRIGTDVAVGAIKSDQRFWRSTMSRREGIVSASSEKSSRTMEGCWRECWSSPAAIAASFH